MRPRLAFCLTTALLLSVVAVGQQVVSPIPQRDPKAIALITQAITAAGGPSAIGAVNDVTATGNITFYLAGKEVPGTVSVKGRGLGEFRIDTTLSDGTVRSAVVNNGTASSKRADGNVKELVNQHTDAAGASYLPYLELAEAVANPLISITDLGMVTYEGQQAHGIRLKTVFSHREDPFGTRAKLSQRDFFFDPASLLVVRTEDLTITRSNFDPRVPHDVLFSDYRKVDRVLCPFSITETIYHQHTATIQFNKVSFNGGLSEADFQQ